MTTMILVRLDRPAIFEKGGIFIPYQPFSIDSLFHIELDEVAWFLDRFPKHILVDPERVGVKVALEVSVTQVFRERAKEGDLIVDIAEVGIAARVDVPLFPRMRKDIIVPTCIINKVRWILAFHFLFVVCL